MRRTLFSAGLTLATLLCFATVAEAAVTRSTAPGAAIPDNTCLDDTATGTGLGGITSTIDYSDLSAGVISDVNVRLEITHTWRSDLQVALNLGAATVRLLNSHDSSGDNYYATLDDEGAALCSDAANCGTGTNCTAAPGPVCQPNEALTAFDTLNAGLFTLNVCDRIAADTGTLVLWELTVDGTPPLPVELTGFSIQ